MLNVNLQRWDGGVRVFGSSRELVEEFGQSHYFDGGRDLTGLEEKLSRMMNRQVAVTSRGMTAIEAVIFALTSAENRVACSEDVYPGTRGLLKELETAGRIEVAWFDPSDLGRIEYLLGLDARLVFTETIGNAKQMRVADVPAMARLCKQDGACLVVDTTFTPLYRPPRQDHVITVCSMTKWHQPGDENQGGFIAATKKTMARIRASRMFGNRRMLPSVTAAYLKTYKPSEKYWRAASRNTLGLAETCEKHPAVKAVYYPGLKSHPQYRLAKRLYGQAGGVMYLELAGGQAAAEKLTDYSVEKSEWQIAVSFGNRFWRILPWIGPLRPHADCDGLLRLAPGWIHNLLEKVACIQVLDSLR